MTNVREQIDLRPSVYRHLEKIATSKGMRVHQLIERVVERSVFRPQPNVDALTFDEWLLSRDPNRVRHEVHVPSISEIRQHAYNTETKRLLAQMRAAREEQEA